MSGMYPANQDISIFGEQVRWPGVDENGKFTNGSFDDPMRKPSYIPPAETINLILDNLSAIIEKCGGVPNATNLSQIAGLMTHLAAPKRIVMRDENGRAKVESPAEPDDIARQAEIDAAKEEIGADIQELRDAQKGYDLYQGGRNLLSVYDVDTVPELMAILHEKCNGEGKPDFDNLFIGDYVDIPSLIVDGITYANQRILLSGLNHYRNVHQYEGYRNIRNHILFTFDKIVMEKRMNPSNTNTGGYPSSELRVFLEGAAGDGSGLFAVGLKEAIGDYLYTVKKYASIKGGMARGNYTLFPPTALEVGAPFYYDSNGIYPDDEEDNTEMQRRFPIYNVRRFQKKNGFSYDWYWVSSPYSGSAAEFCNVNNNGLANNNNASNAAGGVAPDSVRRAMFRSAAPMRPTQKEKASRASRKACRISALTRPGERFLHGRRIANRRFHTRWRYAAYLAERLCSCVSLSALPYAVQGFFV